MKIKKFEKACTAGEIDREKMPLEEAYVGDAYRGDKLREIPKSLIEATDAMRGFEQY